MLSESVKQKNRQHIRSVADCPAVEEKPRKRFSEDTVIYRVVNYLLTSDCNPSETFTAPFLIKLLGARCTAVNNAVYRLREGGLIKRNIARGGVPFQYFYLDAEEKENLKLWWNGGLRLSGYAPRKVQPTTAAKAQARPRIEPPVTNPQQARLYVQADHETLNRVLADLLVLYPDLEVFKINV